MCTCVRVCVRMCLFVRLCVRVCVRVRVRTHGRLSFLTCSLSTPTLKPKAKVYVPGKAT